MKKICLVACLVLMLPIYLFSQDTIVTFSHSGGFYQNSFSLELTCDEAYHIRYTTNGGTPTANSTLYEAPLVLNKNLLSNSNIYTIVNCIPSVYHSVDDVERCIVIRAGVFDENDSCVSRTTTNSYFIGSLGCDLHGLPVISIATDSLSLFDYDTGIFIPGASYDPSDSTHTGNYCNHGREWERRINVEFYETDNTGINQQCGLRAHGGASRWFQQKGMKLYARDEYGKKRFKHKFFEHSNYNSFKRLCLHPFCCSNWIQTGGQEYLSQRIASNLDIDALAVRQTAVFINGEYWGIYTLEEATDERYLEDHYNVDLETVNIIQYWPGISDYGDPTDWISFYNWINNADLTQPADSLNAFTRIDMLNFIDYMIFEIFSANLDWPQNNVKIWQNETGDKFRFIFYDGDGCFTNWQFLALNHAMNSGGNSRVFNHFCENESFKRMFIDRYQELKSTFFDYDAMNQYLIEYQNIIEEEVPKQSARFGFPLSFEKWESDMAKADEFLLMHYTVFEEELFQILNNHEIENEGFACYPNPSNGKIFIEINDNQVFNNVIQVFNIFGTLVYKDVMSTTLSLDLPIGIYFINIGNSTQRIIIQ